MSGYVELTLEQGSDFNAVLNLTDSSGTALNLTNYSIESQMRKSYYSSTATDFVMTITSIATGEISMAMSAANTSNLTPGRYVYDVLVTDNSNIKTRIIEGIINVKPSVTR